MTAENLVNLSFLIFENSKLDFYKERFDQYKSKRQTNHYEEDKSHIRQN